MALRSPVAKLGPGTFYRKSFVTDEDAFGTITGFFTNNIKTTADLQNAANSFPSQFGNEASMPKRTVEVSMIGGGQAIGIARYHRRGIKPIVRWRAGIQQVPVWQAVDGTLNKDYDIATGEEEPKQRHINVVVVTFTWEAISTGNPVTQELLGAVGKVNSNPVTIQGQGATFSFTEGYLYLEGPSGAEYVWGTTNHFDSVYTATYSSFKWQRSFLDPPANPSTNTDPIPGLEDLYESAPFPDLPI